MIDRAMLTVSELAPFEWIVYVGGRRLALSSSSPHVTVGTPKSAAGGWDRPVWVWSGRSSRKAGEAWSLLETASGSQIFTAIADGLHQ